MLTLSLQVRTSCEINQKEFLTHVVEISATNKEQDAVFQLSSQTAVLRYEEAIGDKQETKKQNKVFSCLLPDFDLGVQTE